MIRVWDGPLRLFKWGFVFAVTGAVLTGLSGDMELHARFGFAAGALVLFRLFWGLVGSETSRFSHFVKGPEATRAYLRDGSWGGLGHNPLGALSILALLGLVGFKFATGLFSNDDIFFDGPWAGWIGKEVSDMLTGWHDQSTPVLYAVIGLHVAAIFWYYAKGEDLFGPMVIGEKNVEAEDPLVSKAAALHWAPLWRAAAAAAIALFFAGIAMRYWIT